MDREPGSVFADAELLRYSRQMTLPEVGIEGQQKLRSAKVVIVGAGGLGNPVALYLAAAGVGTLGIVEFDRVDTSNLHRQILYGTADVGMFKLDVAEQRLKALNPHIQINRHLVRLSSENALEIFAGYDLLVDATDNFSTRYLINDACVLLGKMNVHASIFRFEGLLSIFGSNLGPCYRCLHPEPPPAGVVPSCAEAGVLGVLPGIMGSLQAGEVIKLLLGVGKPLIGRLLRFDALKMQFDEFQIESDPDCQICSGSATIRTLINYDEFCGVKPEEDISAAVITADELEGLLSSGSSMVLIDVRSQAEFSVTRIEGAILVPLELLNERLHEFSGEELIVCYCQSGIRSAKALRMFKRAGVSQVYGLEGGMNAWLEALSDKKDHVISL